MATTCENCGKSESEHEHIQRYCPEKFTYPPNTFKPKPEQPAQCDWCGLTDCNHVQQVPECGCNVNVDANCPVCLEEENRLGNCEYIPQPAQELPGVQDYIRDHGMPPYNGNRPPTYWAHEFGMHVAVYSVHESEAWFDSQDAKIAELEKELRVMKRALEKAAGDVNDLNGHFNYYDYKAVTSKDYIEAARKDTE